MKDKMTATFQSPPNKIEDEIPSVDLDGIEPCKITKPKPSIDNSEDMEDILTHIGLPIPKPKDTPEMIQERLELLKEAQNIADNIVIRRTRRNLSAVIPNIYNVRTFHQGNYTVVLLNEEVIGVSKRNKIDKSDKKTGIRLALYRAVRRLTLLAQRK